MVDYVVSGLIVKSDIPFHGLTPSADRGRPADIVIRAGAVPSSLADATAQGPNWQLAGEHFLIAIPGIVRMMLHAGRELRYEVLRGAAPEDAAIFLSGTGFGILLHQRRQIVLHASAVRVGEGAALFCGPSGAGKSTLAAALVDRGHALLADDFCSLTMAPSGTALVRPDCRQLKLWRQAIEHLDLTDRAEAPVRPCIEKYFVEPRAVAPAAVPLAAIYVLREARPPLPAGIERSNIVDGALAIRRNAYRPAMVHRMGQESLYFEAAAAIAQRAGIFTLTRPFSFGGMSEVLDWLDEHWTRIGLREMAA